MLIQIPEDATKAQNVINKDGNELLVTTYVWYKRDMAYSYSFYQDVPAVAKVVLQ